MGVGLVALAIVIAAAVIAVGLVLPGGARPVAGTAATPTPGAVVTDPPSPAPTPSTSASASTEPPATQGPSGLPSSTFRPLPTPDGSLPPALQASPLYALPAPQLHGCPAPARPSSEQQWRDAVRAQWRCVHEAWTPVYEQLGVSTEPPPVYFYPGKGSKSDCGYFEAPAFYCAARGGSVYFGGEHLAIARDWDLAINEMVNHEYSHHVQSVTGISGAWGELGHKPSLVRRSELQAVCWSAMMTALNDAVDFDAAAYASWDRRLETMRESEEHGRRASLTAWGRRGLHARTIGDCNTWTADEQSVR